MGWLSLELASRIRSDPSTDAWRNTRPETDREIQLARHMDGNQLDPLDIDHFGFEAVLFKEVGLFGRKERIEVGARRRVSYSEALRRRAVGLPRVKTDQHEQSHQPD